jgi:hypothetical protein
VTFPLGQFLIREKNDTLSCLAMEVIIPIYQSLQGLHTENGLTMVAQQNFPFSFILWDFTTRFQW